MTGLVGGADATASGERGNGYVSFGTREKVEGKVADSGEDKGLEVAGGKVYDDVGPGVRTSEGEIGEDERVLNTIGEGTDRAGVRGGRKVESQVGGPSLCSTRRIWEQAWAMRAYSQSSIQHTERPRLPALLNISKTIQTASSSPSRSSNPVRLPRLARASHMSASPVPLGLPMSALALEARLLLRLLCVSRPRRHQAPEGGGQSASCEWRS